MIYVHAKNRLTNMTSYDDPMFSMMRFSHTHSFSLSPSLSPSPPHRCEVCGFQCRQRASLKYHMTKHKAEADLEFACVLCSKRFEKAHNLNVHMSMVHLLTQGEALRGAPLQQRPEASQLYTDITETGEVVHQQDQER